MREIDKGTTNTADLGILRRCFMSRYLSFASSSRPERRVDPALAVVRHHPADPLARLVASFAEAEIVDEELDDWILPPASGGTMA